MIFPSDALPPSPATVDPTLQDVQDPLTLPASDLEDLGLVGSDEGYTPYETSNQSAPQPQELDENAPPQVLNCADLERLGLWDTTDCCHDMCHSYEPIAPAPLRHRHVTVQGCCASHEALNHLNPPRDDFISKLFR